MDLHTWSADSGTSGSKRAWGRRLQSDTTEQLDLTRRDATSLSLCVRALRRACVCTQPEREEWRVGRTQHSVNSDACLDASPLELHYCRWSCRSAIRIALFSLSTTALSSTANRCPNRAGSPVHQRERRRALQGKEGEPRALVFSFLHLVRIAFGALALLTPRHAQPHDPHGRQP